MWVFHGGDLGGGVVFAAVVGASLGLMHAGFTVWLGLSQHVAGIGLTMLASALSFFTFRMLLPSSTTPPRIQAFQPVDLGPLGDLPFVGEALLRHTQLTYAALLAVPAVIYVMYRNPLGLALRMAGANPRAVGGRGVDVLGGRRGGGQEERGVGRG